MIKVLEIFSGVGSQHKALSNLNMNFEVVGTVEWTVDAIISYDAMHTDDGIDYTKDMNKEDILKELEHFTFSTDGKKPCEKIKIKLTKLRQLYNANKRSKNLGDVTKIQDVPLANLWTYSSPCQSISVAGKQEGLTKDSGTASSLIWDVERLLEIAQLKNELPEYLLLENVKNLVGKQFKPEFDKWVSRLEEFGYDTYWKVLNSKNMGISQNRERLFAISIRKDVGDKKFQFPSPFDNGLRLKDFLESNVDEKYYISKDKTDKLLSQLKDKQMSKQAIQINRGNLKIKDDDICSCLDANYWKGLDNHAARTGVMDNESNQEETNTLNRIGNIYNENFGTGYAGNVWDIDYICPTVTTCQGGGREPHILEDFYTNRDIREYEETCPTLRADRQGLKVVEEYTNELKFVGGIQTGEMWIDDGKELSRNYRSGNRVYDSDGIAVAQTAEGGGLAGYTGMYKVSEPNYRIRKLTPRECFMLQGFSSLDFDKCKNAGISDSGNYKSAGNSITCTVLMGIFGELFNVEYKDKIKDIRKFYDSLNT